MSETNSLPTNYEIARLAQRLWSHTKRVDGGCLVWTRSTYRRGYGKMFVSGYADGKPRLIATHRIAWMLTNGDIPSDLIVRHACDNPPCCEPTHLLLGTAVDNMRDMMERGRGVQWQSLKTHCPQGHAYDKVNTYDRSDGTRGCRACQPAYQKRYQEKRKTVPPRPLLKQVDWPANPDDRASWNDEQLRQACAVHLRGGRDPVVMIGKREYSRRG